MIYLFHEDAGNTNITLKDDAFKHMIKARRQSVGDSVLLRKIDDEHNYTYTITESTKKEATLRLENSQAVSQKLKPLHIGWCMIDPKSIEKVLPSLCELGVTNISFIYAQRSQKNFQIDEKRLERIMINSMQQCGRYTKIELIVNVNLDDFILNNPDTVVLDFCDKNFSTEDNFSSVLLGPEGGFAHEEKELLKSLEVRRLDTPMVLRSETAAVAIASKLLL